MFHDQIEAKQKELQPWTAQINAKQAEIDVAASERDALAKKAEVVRDASAEAQGSLRTLQTDQEAKMTELEELRASRANLQKEIQAAGRNLQVGWAQMIGMLLLKSAFRIPKPVCKN